MAAVGKEVGRTAAVVLAVLDKYNIPKRTKGGIYPLPKDEIIQKYTQDKKTLQTIADEYNVSLNTIKKILVDNKIKIRTSSESKNPYFNKNMFKSINSEASAYFLGLMITDGCILEPDLKNNHPNYKMQIELQEGDRYILETLKKELQLSSTNLYESSRIKGNTESKTVSLGWYSTEMANDLKQYGVIPRKTSTVYLPILDDEYMPHLIRGMIDGDGCLTITHPKGRPRLSISFCGNQQCVTQLRDFLSDTLSVKKNIVLQAGENLWQTAWSSKDDCFKICEYIYKDATIFLTRKKDKYLFALNDFKDNTEVS